MDVVGLLAKHLIAPALAARDESRYLRLLRHYRRTQFLSADELNEYRWRRLRSIVEYAYSHSPFYRERFRRAGVTPSDLSSPDHLRAFPRLTKSDVQDHLDELAVPPAAGDAYLTKRTSGSTGTPLRVLMDRRSWDYKWAATIRHNQWAGYDLGDQVGLIWGDIPSPTTLRGRLRRQLFERIVVLDSQRLNEDTMSEFCGLVRRLNVRCLLGQAQPLFVFAEFVRDHDSRPLPVRAAIATAMVLRPEERALIESALGCRVFERYGAEETSIIASECPAHQGMHIYAEGLWLEFERDHRPVSPGEEGEVLVTDLVNHAMPLIRYEIGDLAIPSDRQCPCGRSLPLLERVSGRVADCLVSPDGVVVSGIAITDHLVQIPGIRQAQIVQEQTDELIFKIVKGPGFTPNSIELLRRLVRRIFGGRMRFHCEFLERIPLDASGKRRFCISHVARPGIAPPEAPILGSTSPRAPEANADCGPGAP